MDISVDPSYRGYRFPREIIGYCVWLYFRFSVSYRDVEELMAERGVTVTYETIRAWCDKFGRDYARRIRARRGMLGEQFLSIFGMIADLFGVGRHLPSAPNYRLALSRRFAEWRDLVG